MIFNDTYNVIITLQKSIIKIFGNNIEYLETIRDIYLKHIKNTILVLS